MPGCTVWVTKWPSRDWSIEQAANSSGSAAKNILRM
jgi:hypothetical protein